jgi:hypothetical protein
MNKQSNSLKMKMNGIQTRIDRFGNYFVEILQRCPWLILLTSVVLASGLTVYFVYFLQLRPFDQTDFFIFNGPAMKNAQRLRKIFGNDKYQRVHQQMDLYPALDVIIRRKSSSTSTGNDNDTTMLDMNVINEVGEKCQ